MLAAALQYFNIMPPLTRQQFSDRVTHIARARRIFISTGVTTSIDAAFEMYLSVFPDLDLPAAAPLPFSPVSRACPICGLKPLLFQSGCCGKSAPSWSCPRCNYKELSHA